MTGLGLLSARRTLPPPRVPTTGAHSRRQRRAIWSSLSFTATPRLPLLIIMTVQVALSLRLVWSNTAFSDEALYLSGRPP